MKRLTRKGVNMLREIGQRPCFSESWPIIDRIVIEGPGASFVSLGLVRVRKVYLRTWYRRRYLAELVYTITPFGRMVLMIEAHIKRP